MKLNPCRLCGTPADITPGGPICSNGDCVNMGTDDTDDGTAWNLLNPLPSLVPCKLCGGKAKHRGATVDCENGYRSPGGTCANCGTTYDPDGTAWNKLNG
jgi:hypothetical protein